MDAAERLAPVLCDLAIDDDLPAALIVEQVRPLLGSSIAWSGRWEGVSAGWRRPSD